MRQATGYSVAPTRWDVANEISIYAQAIWHLGSRSLARYFGFFQKGKSKGQARYKQFDSLPPAPGGKRPGKKANLELNMLPTGNLTEIRSIAYLNGTCSAQAHSRNLQQGLKQMLPAVAGFCQQRWLVLVAPPCLPSVAELRQAGINPARVLVVHPEAENGLGVLEQTLRSGTCGAVLAWLEKGDAQTLDHLRQAAEAGNAWGVLFRTAQLGKEVQPVQILPAQQVEDVKLKIAIS